MDSFFVLAIGAALWLLVGPIVALVMAANASRRSRELLLRLEAWETQLSRTPAAALRQAAPQAATAPAPFAAQPVSPLPVAPAATTAAQPPEPAASAQPPSEPTPAAPPTSEPSPPIEPPPAAAPARPRESLESKIGARWTVLVGGLALALGAIFLVRYTIEAGLLGPGARIVLGFLLSVVLFGAGEWLRQRDRAHAAPIFAKADVPAILTGAGGIALFATIYAAHALYGFIGAGGAFVLLTAAGLITLFLSVIHGPGLAALGALGSYVAPLLVSSAQPAALPVVLHTLAVTAAVLGMARIRTWTWLAIGGIAASLLWGLLIGWMVTSDVTGAELLLTAGLAITYLGALVYGSPDSLRDRPPNLIALAALSGLATLTLWFTLLNPAYPTLISGIVLAGTLGAAATRWTSIAPAITIASTLAIATTMLLPTGDPAGLTLMRIGAFEWYVLGDASLPRFALKAAAIAAVIGIGAFLSADRAAGPAPRSAGWFATAGAGAPLLILVVVYLRHAPFETRPAIGIAALVLAAIYAAMTERLIAHRPTHSRAPAPALYAAGAVLALSFAASVGLATRFIPIALSLGAAGVVWVSLQRPVRLLPWLAVVLAVLACVAIVTGPPFTPEEIGTRPFLNGLILKLGLPAAALLVAGEMLRRFADGVPAGILQASGLVLAALFVVFEIRHFSGGGDLNAGWLRLGEQSAYTLAALAFSLGLQRIARNTRSKVYEAASLVAGVIGALTIAVAHLVTVNPFFTAENVGEGHVFNLLLVGYLLPALLAAWVAAAARAVRPRWFVLMMAALALLLAFAWLSLTVRHAFRGAVVEGWEISDAENWTYSAVWLAFGILLLVAGIFMRSTMVRAASGLVIALVVFKVFLFDMAALTGALRAASFLGLGAVLIVIGRLYQKLLMRGRTDTASATAPS